MPDWRGSWYIRLALDIAMSSSIHKLVSSRIVIFSLECIN